MRNFRRVTLVQAASLAAFFLFVFAYAAAAEDWASPARALEKKIVEKLKPGQSVTLSLQNLSSLSADEAALVRKDLETELRAQGLRVKANGKKATGVSEEAVAEIRVTLAENSQGLLWVAEIGKGEDREVVMQAVPRAATAETSASAPAMLVQSQMLLRQEAPILDFALLGLPTPAAKRLLVLEPARVALYVLGQGGWQLAQAAAISPPDPAQRDLRGSLRFDPLQVDNNGKFTAIKDSFSVILPGEICQGVWDTLTLKCVYESTWRRPWDERSGVIWPNPLPELQRDAAAYSVARIQVKGRGMEIDAGKDGVARLYRSDDEKGPVATFPGWGSDLAALKTGCGSGWQILVTRASDYTEKDAVQAFEITDKQTVPASPPLEFAGPVIALHASPGADAGLAVVRNLKTGQYETHVLSLSCGH